MGETLRILVSGLPTTFAVTAVALVIGLVAAVPLTVLRRASWTPARWAAGALIEVVRTVPPLVWIFVVYYSVGSSKSLTMTPNLAAMVGLGIIAAAYIAEIYRGAVQSIPRGQYEASTALGIPRHIAYARVIVPQSLILIVAPATSYAVSLLKDSSLASVIGARDTTFMAFEHVQLTFKGLQTFTLVGVIYLVLSLLIAWLGSMLDTMVRRRLFRG